MKIAFRVDASLHIGSGHVMRCLTLGERLRERGSEVLFVCRKLERNLCNFIQEKGFDVAPLPAPESMQGGLSWNAHAPWLEVPWDQDAEETAVALRKYGPIDWVIVDHYALDSNWETKVGGETDNILAIDDLADRSHDCALLLDQNYYPDMESRYKGLVPASCRRLLGPTYALLRKEFQEARKYLERPTGAIRNILVFFGGVDLTNETQKALQAIQRLDRPDLLVEVVVGSGNPHKEKIRTVCQALPNCRFYCQVDNMAELMARADIAIGAAGASTWERCSLSLPAIVIAVAFNQIEIAKAAASLGIVKYLGHSENVSADEIGSSLDLLLNNPMTLRGMIVSSGSLVDGAGIDRVVALLEKK